MARVSVVANGRIDPVLSGVVASKTGAVSKACRVGTLVPDDLWNLNAPALALRILKLHDVLSNDLAGANHVG
jgi:hypothetical protein